MALRIVFLNPNVGAEFRKRMTDTLNGIAKASSLATRETAKLIKQRGQADIQSAGQFGARWSQGLSVVPDPPSGFFISNTITVTHNQIGARNFEFGGTIVGKPLLWIPLSFSDAKGKRARNYPGGLFRLNRPNGRPLLLSKVDKKPKFVGVARVRIPQKFHLRDIGNEAMRKDFPKLFRANLKA